VVEVAVDHVGQNPAEQCFAGPRRSVEQVALGNLGAEQVVDPFVFLPAHDTLHVGDGFVTAGNVVERQAFFAILGLEGFGLGLAHADDAGQTATAGSSASAATALNSPPQQHDGKHDHDRDDYRPDHF